ncbi:hypothetical protein E6H12_01260 [Candidatus Bathyarchaeota archaeon]|nr:MAG: hypothetical protein E6H12_01260 [Candidatus Bathyarchaeota archaeon]
MSQPWMGAPNLPGIGGTSTSRYVALVAVLTAIFTAYGYISSIELRTVTRSLDLFFLLPAFFAILVSLTGKKWAGTILGTVIGLIFLGTPSAGSNFSPHITASVIVNGLVFDLYLQRSGGSLLDPSRKHLVLAGTLGNLAMAPTGLLVLQAVGVPSLAVIWTIALIGDTLVGAAGAFFGTIIVERVKGLQARRVLEAKSAVRVRV